MHEVGGAWSLGRGGMKLNHHIIHFFLCLLQNESHYSRVAALGGEGGGHGMRKSPEVEDSNPFLLPAWQVPTSNSTLSVASEICL